MSLIHSNTAESVKQALTMRQVAEQYGYEVNKANFISCPLHSEKTASCKIYENSFYCFGCGAGGDVIRFVQAVFSLNFSQSVARLNYDFHLGLGYSAPSRTEINERARQKAEARRIEQIKLAIYHNKQDIYRKLWQKSKTTELTPIEKTRLDFLSDWLDRHLALDFDIKSYIEGGKVN